MLTWPLLQPGRHLRQPGNSFGRGSLGRNPTTSPDLWFQCHTRASPIEDLDLATCLASDGPVRDQLGELLINLLAGAHTGGGRRRRMLSGRQLAGEAERIMAGRDYTPFPVVVDGVQTSGLRLNDRPAVPDATAMSLVVHHGHLVAIESHDGAGDPHALATDSDVAAVKAAR